MMIAKVFYLHMLHVKAESSIIIFIMLISLLLLSPKALGRQIQSKLDQQIDSFDSEAQSCEEQLIEIAQRFQIPIGIEWSHPRAKKSAPPVHLREVTIREAIRHIIQNSGHEFEMRDGIIHIFSASFVSDGRNFLNLRIPEFSLSNANLISASHQLKKSLFLSLHPGSNYGGGYGYGTPRDDGFDKDNISFSGQNLTVREILTKIVTANGNALWIVRLIPSQMMTNEPFFVQGPLSDENRNATNFIWQFISLGKAPSQNKSQ